MPLRLNVGVSKKLGLPAYSSVGASCNLDLELDHGLLRDPAGLRDQVRGAFAAAREAVEAELARIYPEGDPAGPHAALALDGPPLAPRRSLAEGGPSTPRTEPSRPPRPGKPATPSQVRAILSIARRNHADLDGLLCDLGVARPEELSLAAASALIDQLKAAGA